MKFGKRLRLLRQNKKLTQKELAKLINISESAVGMYERDEREPSFDLINKIAGFFEVTTDYLLGRSDQPEFSKAQSDFIKDVSLSIDELKEKYNLIIDGESATNEELMGAIAFIRASRMIKEK